MYHGWADHSITPVGSIQYYAEVIETMTDTAAEENTYVGQRLLVCSWRQACIIAAMDPAPTSLAAQVRGSPHSVTRSTTLSWRSIVGWKMA